MPKEQETSAAQVIPEAAARRICGKAGGRTRFKRSSEKICPSGAGDPIGDVISFDFAKTAQVIPVWYYQDAFAEKQAEGRA